MFFCARVIFTLHDAPQVCVSGSRWKCHALSWTFIKQVLCDWQCTSAAFQTYQKKWKTSEASLCNGRAQSISFSYTFESIQPIQSGKGLSAASGCNSHQIMTLQGQRDSFPLDWWRSVESCAKGSGKVGLLGHWAGKTNGFSNRYPFVGSMRAFGLS